MILKLNEIEKRVVFVAVSFCLCILFINIIMRYVFRNALGWTEELASYLQIFIVYVGASVAAFGGDQIKIGILLDLFPNKRKYIDFLSDVVAFIYSICLIVLGAQFVKVQWITCQKSVALGIPMFLIYSIAILGGLLMSIKYGHKIAIFVKEITRGIQNAKEEQYK